MGQNGSLLGASNNEGIQDSTIPHLLSAYEEMYDFIVCNPYTFL